MESKCVRFLKEQCKRPVITQPGEHGVSWFGPLPCECPSVGSGSREHVLRKILSSRPYSAGRCDVVGEGCVPWGQEAVAAVLSSLSS